MPPVVPPLERGTLWEFPDEMVKSLNRPISGQTHYVLVTVPPRGALPFLSATHGNKDRPKGPDATVLSVGPEHFDQSGHPCIRLETHFELGGAKFPLASFESARFCGRLTPEALQELEEKLLVLATTRPGYVQ